MIPTLIVSIGIVVLSVVGALLAEPVEECPCGDSEACCEDCHLCIRLHCRCLTDRLIDEDMTCRERIEVENELRRRWGAPSSAAEMAEIEAYLGMNPSIML